jgi:hypothetical protein
VPHTQAGAPRHGAGWACAPPMTMAAWAPPDRRPTHRVCDTEHPRRGARRTARGQHSLRTAPVWPLGAGRRAGGPPTRALVWQARGPAPPTARGQPVWTQGARQPWTARAGAGALPQPLRRDAHDSAPGVRHRWRLASCQGPPRALLAWPAWRPGPPGDRDPPALARALAAPARPTPAATPAADHGHRLRTGDRAPGGPSASAQGTPGGLAHGSPRCCTWAGAGPSLAAPAQRARGGHGATCDAPAASPQRWWRVALTHRHHPRTAWSGFPGRSP